MIKRTALTYIDENGCWYRASKGAPEQVALYAGFCVIIDLVFIGLLTLSWDNLGTTFDDVNVTFLNRF